MMHDSVRLHFAAENSYGHEKEFLRKLSIIWAHALKKLRQPWPKGYVMEVKHSALGEKNKSSFLFRASHLKKQIRYLANS
jgi:hypothetical protein